MEKRTVMSKPNLHLFAISHYCEKARWALDYLGVNYTPVYLPPGMHIVVAEKLGAPLSTVPILSANGAVVQGSSAIIDWAESYLVHEEGHLGKASLSPGNDQAGEMEQRLDQILGVHSRRYYYSEALVEYPGSVKPMFLQGLPARYQAIVERSWDTVSRMMIEQMDLGEAQGLESQALIQAELDWLDDQLSHGRSFLVSNQLSRLDITAASLLAIFVKPAEHPTYSELSIPPRLGQWVAEQQERPCIKWAREIYRTHRAVT